jgi:hypothetical protein
MPTATLRREGGIGRDGGPLLGAILAPLAVTLYEILAVPSETRDQIAQPRSNLQGGVQANSSSSAFASLRSGVSKPSVNQP